MTLDRHWQRWVLPEERAAVLGYWARNQAERAAVHAALFKELDGLRGVSLLDIGCGSGEDTALLARPGVQYMGVDITAEMLDEARLIHPSIRFELDDLLDSRMGDGSFDVVVCNAVLPHLPSEQIPVAIAELDRITRFRVIVGLFGVRPESERMQTKIHRGFIYQQWPIQTWLALFDAPRVHHCGAGCYVLAYDKTGALS